MRIIARKSVTPPPSGDLRDGKPHEMRYAGGRHKTDTGFETLIVCRFCSSEYAVDDCDWFTQDFLESIRHGEFRCPVCNGGYPDRYYWKIILDAVQLPNATPGEASAKMFFKMHEREMRTRYRIDRIKDRFAREAINEYGIKYIELDDISDPTVASMVYRLCYLGEKVKALEAALIPPHD